MIRQVLVTNRYQEHYKPVNPNLAVTPKDMEKMTAQGRSISANSLENFIYFNGDMLDGLPIDMCRGVDINDIYQASQVSKAKMSRLRTKRAREIHATERADSRKGGE